MVTELLGITHPLVGFNRSPAVVAEVSRCGGLGVLAATAYAPDELDAQLTWIEQHAGGASYGVDLLVPDNVDPLTHPTRAEDHRVRLATLRDQIPQQHLEFVCDLLARHGVDPAGLSGAGEGERTANAASAGGVDALLDVVLEHPIALVANALGPAPDHLVARAHEKGIAVAALVGNGRHAARQLQAGVDILVAQGTEAGGHTGSISTMVLTPEIVDLAGDVPVLAAGGIASGRQMAAALALGAAGVWCGSVWLNTTEDITPGVVKEKFIGATSGDTVRSRTRTGKPARQLRSAWHDAWEAPGAPEPLPMQPQVMLAKDAWALIDDAAETGHPGAVELESFFIGQVVGGFGALRSTAEVVTDLVADCADRLQELGSMGHVPAATPSPHDEPPHDAQP